jgi:hypothetical protein
MAPFRRLAPRHLRPADLLRGLEDVGLDGLVFAGFGGYPAAPAGWAASSGGNKGDASYLQPPSTRKIDASRLFPL